MFKMQVKSSASRKRGFRSFRRNKRGKKSLPSTQDSHPSVGVDLNLVSENCDDTTVSSNQEDPAEACSHCEGMAVTNTKDHHSNGALDYSDRTGGQISNPMTARFEALQIQQQMLGMHHPDVLFALKHLGRAHRRRGELQQAQLIDDMVRAGYDSQEEHFSAIY